MTLILTTNREPPEGLVHDIQVAVHQAEIDVEIYTGSVIADFLDNEPRGQWLRYKYLGIVPSQLSKDLLHELSVKSITSAGFSDVQSWVERDIDEQLVSYSRDPVRFIVGESGMGKTVACRKCLERHIADGGFGLWVSAETLAKSHTPMDAIGTTLRELHPPLAVDESREALMFATETMPFLIVVEDVNRSAAPGTLLEQLASWDVSARQGSEHDRWNVLCPAWPRTIALLSDVARKSVSRSFTWISGFTEEEGIAAVQRRCGGSQSVFDAKAVASALGYDPLLIALHGGADESPDPTSVIRLFVERCLLRLAENNHSYTAGEYRHALMSFSAELLERKTLEPLFIKVVEWMEQKPGTADMLRVLVAESSVVRLEGPVTKQRIVFRHDRVREHILADTAAHAMQQGNLSVSVMSDPYFAEVMGLVLAENEVTRTSIEQVASKNPLSLFAAMRHFREPRTEAQCRVVDAASDWADSGVADDHENEALRIAVLRVLADCEGPHVKSLVGCIDGDGINWWALRARFRNGDIEAGIRLCAHVEPGTDVVGHVELIEYVLRKAGTEIVHALDRLLRNQEASRTARVGALRLAGFAGSHLLSEALREAWRADGDRQVLLADYLWACSHCCGDDPTGLLGPVLDEWAAMPEEDGQTYPRASLGAHHVRWAFRDRVPEDAIGYFIQRAAGLELRWPLLLMLNGIDNPQAVEFVVRELARRDEETNGHGGIWPFRMLAIDEWQRRSDHGGALMQAGSRQRLREMWSNESNGTYLRRRALEVWSATIAREDVALLQTVDTKSVISDMAVFQRFRRGDRTAIGEFVAKLEQDSHSYWYWWQAVGHLWSEELTECLDRTLSRIVKAVADPESDAPEGLEFLLSERLMELPPATAECLIEKYWNGLCHLDCYVQAALYLATPNLQRKVRKVVEQSNDPKSIFRYLQFRFGIMATNRRGITRISQMETLVPYLEYLEDSDWFSLWEECNRHGWFDWRRVHLDSRVSGGRHRFVDHTSVLKDLDQELARARGGYLFWVNHWAEAVLKTGISLDEMMQLVKDWLKRHGDENALNMTIDLVTQFGRRRHLAVLDGHASSQSERGRALIANATFRLRMRSLE